MQPYVKAQKNDDRDAEAIAEAATRPTMRFVELKSEAQLDMQSLHRSRDRLVGERTALINQLRGLLSSAGFSVPKGRRKLELYLDELMRADPVSLSTRIRMMIDDMRIEWRELDVLDLDLSRTNFGARLAASRYDGFDDPEWFSNATALAAAIGNGENFKRGRDLDAWLAGAEQMTPGGKPR